MDNTVKSLVSVVTAFYNEEKFLEQTIQSVINQTYPNWELLLIDDGSKDISTDIAKKYEQQYPGKIKYLEHGNHANKGLTRSRNLGIAHARGEYVCYLDADDVWLPDKLKNQVTIFEQNPGTTVLLEASTYWYSWESPERTDVTIEIGAKQNQLYNAPELILELYPLGQGAAPVPSGIMVKRSVHEKTLFVEEFFGPNAVYEDQAFLSQFYLKEQVYVSSQANNLYRQRKSSMVYNTHNDGSYHKVRAFYLNWFKDYLTKNNIHYPKVDSLLRKNLFPYRYPFLNKLIGKAKKVIHHLAS